MYRNYILLKSTVVFISPHGIAMLKDLYFTTVGFAFFFATHMSQITKRISTKLGHIFTYDWYMKNLVRTPQGIYSTWAGSKKRFLWPTLNFDRTYLCNRTWYQQSERNLSIYRDSTIYKPPNLLTFGPKTVENGCQQLHPKFSHWETLPVLPHGHYITDSRQNSARVM